MVVSKSSRQVPGEALVLYPRVRHYTVQSFLKLRPTCAAPMCWALCDLSGGIKDSVCHAVLACANATSSTDSYNSSKPFNLTTPVSQQYVGRELPSGYNVTSLGDQGETQHLPQMNALSPELPCITTGCTILNLTIPQLLITSLDMNLKYG